MTASSAGLLARVVRGGFTESVHLGHLVALGPDGGELLAVGDPDATVLPRSSLKPLQALAVLRAGTVLDDEALALACASHSGTERHVAVVRRVLAAAGLTERDLQNTPDLPLDADAATARRVAGHGPAAVTQNCSGKHAAMLAACVHAGWPTVTYREPDHPLQRLVRETVAELTGVPVAVTTVDGCGAPLLSTTTRGLARSFAALVTRAAGDPTGAEAHVVRAMTAHPELVGGPGRDVTDLMTAVPGLVAKDGAEGVYAAALPGGAAVALKVADGAARPRAVVLAAALEAVWAAGAAPDPGEDVRRAVAEAARVTVLGHGVPVGEVVADPGGTW